MNGDKKIYAHFEELPKPTVIVERFGGNDDTATIMCGGKQSANHISVTLDPGATAYLTIIMNDDKYEFLGWYDATGVLLSDQRTYQVELTGDIYVFASVREKHNIKVRVDVNDYNAGWARDDASGKKYYAKEYKLYDDDNRAMTAIPKEGYGFAGWYVNGSCISSSLTLDVKSIGCDANVEARFYNLSNTAELTLSI